MALNCETRQNAWPRRLSLALMILAVWLSLRGTDSVQAQPNPTPTNAVETPSASAGSKVEDQSQAAKPGFWVPLLKSIITFDSQRLKQVLNQEGVWIFAFIALNLIVFVETGLLIGFFLPGDSLLVTAGIVCSASTEWSLPLLLATLCLSAIIGDTVGYSIGYKTGPKIFNREKSFFFHKEHLLAAERFYEAHGGKTIILARFMPIIRTFAPVVAGVGRMDYRRFLFFNIIGGVSWVVSMILIGYFLKDMINPLVRYLLGQKDFDVENHIEKVVIIVVLLSVAPGGVVWLKKKLQGKPPAEPTDPQIAGKIGD